MAERMWEILQLPSCFDRQRKVAYGGFKPERLNQFLEILKMFLPMWLRIAGIRVGNLNYEYVPEK